MSFGGFDDPDFEDEGEAAEEAPDIEQPEFGEEFSTDLFGTENVRRREGNERISPPFLGKLGKARLIAARSKQLELGAPSTIPKERIRSGELNEIAKQELQERVLPIKIIRRFPDGVIEEWLLSEFEYIARD